MQLEAFPDKQNASGNDVDFLHEDKKVIDRNNAKAKRLWFLETLILKIVIISWILRAIA